MFIINSICNLHVCILYAIFQKFLTAPTAYCLDYLANEFAVGNSNSLYIFYYFFKTFSFTTIKCHLYSPVCVRLCALRCELFV